MKKIAIYGAVGIAAFIAVGAVVYAVTKPMEAETYTVEPKTVALHFTEVGETVAGKSVSVYSFSAGKLLAVNVSEGQRVKEGDVICTIDSSDYENAVAQLESSLKLYHDQAVSQGRIQNIAISQNKINAKNETENFEKVKELYENGAASKSEYDTARLRMENALSALRESEEQMAFLQNGGEGQANAEISRLKIEQLKTNIQDCVIRSPISGVITNLAVNNTNMVTNQMPLATIQSENDVRIEVPVSTNDIDNIKSGDVVELSLRRREGDQIFSGVVEKIDDNAKVNVTLRGDTERLVTVSIIPDQKDAFKIGYDVDVTFTYYRMENQLVIPKTAVFEEGDKSFVWAVAHDKLEKREVTVKKVLRTEISIKTGLSAGDAVIVDAGADKLSAGKKIKPVRAEED